MAATPQNPLLVDHQLYLSHNGIHKFSQTSLSRQWSSLKGVKTFEPVMGENLLYVGSSQGLYALDPDSGEIAWRIEETHTIFSPTVVDQLYAGSLHGKLYSINPDNGSINWYQQYQGWIYSPAVVSDQGLMWTGGQAHQAFALAIDDGSQLHAVALSQESIFSPQKIGPQQVAFNLFDGKTALINTKTARIDQYLDGVTQPTNLGFGEQLIYRSDRNGGLTAFDRHNYAQKWYRPLVSHELTMHPGYQGYLLMSDLDNTLVLFDQQKSAEVWRTRLAGRWFSPIQIDPETIIYFKPPGLQPNTMSAVELKAIPTN
jgi:outer membrane protein assembly factor BamB